MEDGGEVCHPDVVNEEEFHEHVCVKSEQDGEWRRSASGDGQGIDFCLRMHRFSRIDGIVRNARGRDLKKFLKTEFWDSGCVVQRFSFQNIFWAIGHPRDGRKQTFPFVRFWISHLVRHRIFHSKSFMHPFETIFGDLSNAKPVLNRVNQEQSLNPKAA
jgi:hypothetical protein